MSLQAGLVSTHLLKVSRESATRCIRLETAEPGGSFSPMGKKQIFGLDFFKGPLLVYNQTLKIQCEFIECYAWVWFAKTSLSCRCEPWSHMKWEIRMMDSALSVETAFDPFLLLLPKWTWMPEWTIQYKLISNQITHVITHCTNWNTNILRLDLIHCYVCI